MDSRQRLMHQLVVRSRGVDEAENYFARSSPNLDTIVESARSLLGMVPPTFGHCVLLSSAWVTYLRDHHSIPAIVVAGDLTIGGIPVFNYKNKLPVPTRTGRFTSATWEGHCWIEAGDFLGDLSIFRTAYAVHGPNLLTDFIVSRFGKGRGALITPHYDLPVGLKYKPKQVLSDSQIECFTDSLGYQLENGLI